MWRAGNQAALSVTRARLEFENLYKRLQSGQLKADFASSLACKRTPHSHAQPCWRAGLPYTSACAGTSLVTTAPAPINACCPIVMPQTIVALAPMLAPRPTRVGAN